MSTSGARAYQTIRQCIVNGQFGPGERLKEDVLTGLCGMSRTPVREALRRLATEGMVTMTPNAGAQVMAVGAQELEEIYALRAMIEGHAARRAAQNISPLQIARLAELAAQMEDVVAEGGDALHTRFTACNGEFHRVILDAAMSPRLSAMAALVIAVPLTLRTLARYSADDRRRSLRHQRELIDAFQTGDGEWAESVMKSHVHAAFQALVRSEAT